MLANHPENLSKESRKWLDHIRACEAAGQTMVEYARARGLNLKGFYNAKTRLIKRGVLNLTQRGGISAGARGIGGFIRFAGSGTRFRV